MLQRSTILCLLVSWAAAFKLSVLNDTVAPGEELLIGWVKDPVDGGLNSVIINLVSPLGAIVKTQTVDTDDHGGPGESDNNGGSDGNEGLDNKGGLSDPRQQGNTFLTVPLGTSPGPYSVVAIDPTGIFGVASPLDTKPITLVSSDDATNSLTSSTAGPISTTNSGSSSETVPPSTSEVGQSTTTNVSQSSMSTVSSASVPTQSPSSSANASGAASTLTSKTPVIVGSIIGALIGTALIILAILVCLRRRKTKKETVQFYEQKMVRPTSPPSTAATDAPLTWEPLTLNQSDSLGRYPPTDVKRAFEPEPLPAYGYSNYDFIEKADYHDVARRSTLPGGAMPLPTTSHNIPKIFTTPATPSVSESSVLNGVSRSFGDVGSALRRDSFDGSPYGGIDGRT